jgi:hypothetical protein
VAVEVGGQHGEARRGAEIRRFGTEILLGSASAPVASIFQL